MEVYKVWTDLSIKGNAHKKMADFTKLTKQASVAVANLNKVMMPLNKNLANMAFNLSEVNPELSRLSMTFIRLNTNTSGARKSMNDFNISLSTANNRTQSLINRNNRLANSFRRVSASSHGAIGGVKGGAGGSAISTGEAFIGAGVIKKLGMRIAPYAGMYGAYEFGKASFQSAAQFESQIGQLQARGFTPAQIADIRKYSISQNIPGVSYNAMISAYSNALMATQDPNQAKFLAPILARGQFAANQLYHGMSNKQQEELVRFAEFRGRGNSAKTAESLGVGLQMMALSGGTIRPNDLAQFMRYGGGAVSNLTNESLLALEPILQLRRGARTGTAFQTMNLQLLTGRMSRPQAMSLQSLGMLGPIEYDKTGRTIGSKFGTFKYADQLRTDPFGFLMKTYLPALKKSGITDPGKIEERMQFDFSRTASQILVSMYENSDKIMRVLIAQGRLVPGSELYNIAIQTPGGATANLMKAWENLKTAFGEFESPDVIKGMNMLADLLNTLAKGFMILSQNKITPSKLATPAFTAANVINNPVGTVVSAIKEAFKSLSINLDGRKVGEGVIDHMSRDMNWGGTIQGQSNANTILNQPPGNYGPVGGNGQ